MNKTILAIINPASAGGKTAQQWPKKSGYFKQQFENFEEVSTKRQGDAVELAKRAVEKNYDYIMAVGGDGTVNEIANGMLLADREKLKTKLIVYAQGTGSDLSRSLELPEKKEEFAAVIKKENIREIKVIEAEFIDHQGAKEKRFFLNIADCGMGAEVAKNLNQSKKNINGSLNYLLKIFQTLFTYRNKEVEVKADQKLIYKGRLNSAIIANGNYFGGGIKIAPAADLFGNKLNLVLLKDFSKLGIILNLIKGYRGNHLSHPLVESCSAEEVIVTSNSNLELELDGESVGIIDAKFKIHDQKIAVLI